MKNFVAVLPVALVLLLVGENAFAQSADVNGESIGAGIAMGLAVLGGAVGQGLTARGMLESVSRNPQAAGKLNAPFYVGLAFIESLALFAFVVAFLIQ
jgi:F-type H+-transporting ATPase subunit c